MPVTLTRGWLKLDAKPAKQALSTWVAKWMFAYTQHLHDNVEQCLAKLAAFMSDVRDSLDSADAESLTAEELQVVRTHILAVTDADEGVDELLEPLRGTVALLRRYGIPLADATVEALERVPFEWEDTKKVVVAAEELLLEKKEARAKELRSEADEFTAKVAAFRAAFREEAPFAYVDDGAEQAYPMLDEWQTRLVQIEGEAEALRDREYLFGVSVHAWRDLPACRADLHLLKLTWDHAVLVDSIFTDWQGTPWAKVDCDGCYGFAKRLQAQVAHLEKRFKAVSAWGVYRGVMTSISDMLVTLPLVQDLRDDAMRERHWKKLMRTCGRTFVMDAKFCLRDLFRLQLHLFADAVADIVEQARQELKIDKHLAKIDNALK